MRPSRRPQLVTADGGGGTWNSEPGCGRGKRLREKTIDEEQLNHLDQVDKSLAAQSNNTSLADEGT